MSSLEGSLTILSPEEVQRGDFAAAWGTALNVIVCFVCFIQS